MIEVEGNWKKFYEANPTDKLILLHATSLDNAKDIVVNGFKTGEKNWKDSEDGYIYLAGSRYNLGTYLHHTQNAIIKVAVMKERLLPDSNSVDWKEFVRLNRKEIKKDQVNLKNLTAFDTFKYIGQVKAKLEDIQIIEYIEVK